MKRLPCMDNSQKIRNMGLLCAACVVVIHLGIPQDSLAHRLLVKGFSSIAVPFFFVVSGYFLSAHFGEIGWWKRETSKRVASLVVPFYAWTFLSILTVIPLSVAADLIAHRPLGAGLAFLRELPWACVLGVDLSEYPYLVPLWFIRCLVLLVGVSPIVLWLVRKWKIYWLMMCFVAMIASAELLSGKLGLFLCRGFALKGLLYFSIGVYVRQNSLRAPSSKHAALSAVIGLILIALAAWGLSGHGAEILFELAVPFVLMSTWVWMPDAKLPIWLTSCSFPIYLMHPLFLPYFGVVVKQIGVAPECVAVMFAKFIVCFAGPIMACRWLRSVSPRTAGFLFGGR